MNSSAPTMASRLLTLSAETIRWFSSAPVVGQHMLSGSPLFTDQALVELLDRMPRPYVHALTMGAEPTRPEDNQLATHDDVSGADLLEAVKRGRLWLNVTRVSRFEPTYRKLLDDVFGELANQVPGLKIDGSQATLLISSPAAQVYYHADAAPTVLFHLRGRKRLYTYPALDERFLSTEHLEDIFASARHEYIPYRPELDAFATAFDLQPGQFATWPQNAPHRVVNLDGLNVSLSAEYFTKASRRRARLYTANRFVRHHLGVASPSKSESGLGPLLKVAMQRTGGFVTGSPAVKKRHAPVFRVDKDAPLGVRPLATQLTVKTFCSLSELRPYAAQLDALNLRSARPEPFSTFSFYENYFENDEFYPRGEGMELRLFAAFEGEELKGLLPLRRVPQRVLGVNAHKLEFFVTHDTDRPRLICAREDEARCAQALYAALFAQDDWSMAEFQQQDAASLLGRAPVPEGYLLREFPSMENAAIATSSFSSLGEFHARCSKKHRNNVSRSVRMLLGAGRLEHLSSDDPKVTPALLGLYGSIEPRSWKAKAQGTITRHERRLRYFRGLLDPAQPMRVSIELVLLNGVPIAGMINGAFDGTLYALQIIYDENFQSLSPGTLALLMGVRRAIEGRFREYNLLSGFSYYKTRWLADVRPTRSVQLFRVGKPHFWKAMLGELRRKVMPALPSNVDFNSVKRAVLSDESGATPPPPLPLAERELLGQRVASLPAGTYTLLGATELQRLMPFETREGHVRRGA